MTDKSKDSTGIVGDRPGSLLRGLVENRLVFQVKSLNAAPPSDEVGASAPNGYEIAILIRFAPKTPWQWLRDVVERHEEVVLYFSDLIEAHIDNCPDDADLLAQWKADLARFAASPGNGFTEFGKDIA